MLGLMQSQPLLISSLIEFAERHHGDGQIVSRRVEGDIHRYTYKELAARSRQLANALDAQGLQFSDRVASLAWNGYRHMEMYFGVSGSGRVLHTINPRLHPEQIAWIVNHAEDQVLCFDLTFLPLVQAVHAKCPTVKKWVALCDADKLPQDSGVPGLVSYESWISAYASSYDWPSFDENSASSMCYTSGTTGNPKAALYSHRSTVLHAYAAALARCDVPVGARRRAARGAHVPRQRLGHSVFCGTDGLQAGVPGPALDGKSVYELIEAETGQLRRGRAHRLADAAGPHEACGAEVLVAQAHRHWRLGLPARHDHSLPGRVRCGGAARLGHDRDEPAGHAVHAQEQAAGPVQGRANEGAPKQGRAIFGVDMKIIDGDGNELPWDGKTYGDLLVRGPWILDTYYKGERPLIKDAQGRGWFPTGDVATIDADGFMQITDRSKDVIKSGGEWISSIDIENIAMAHPAIAMSACVGMPHPKWDERPIVVVVKKPGAEVTREELLKFYEGKTAKWQIPDDVVFVDAIPLGATGKMLKTRLREQLKDYRLPGL
jgi:acyl-CoA synthetase (AMP-forming)/AMP-acid ligase II